jgi:hypothetical protein
MRPGMAMDQTISTLTHSSPMTTLADPEVVRINQAGGFGCG